MSNELDTAARRSIEAWTDHNGPPPGVAERAWSAIQARAAAGDLGPELASGGAGKAAAGWTLVHVLGGALGILGVGGIAALIVTDSEPEPAPAIASAPTSELSPSLEPTPNTPASPSVPPPVEPPAPAVEPASTPSEPARPQERSRRPRPADPEPAPEIATDTLAAEMALLAAARKALKTGDADEALEQLAAHAEQFPKGALASERELSRVTALCQAGREAEAVKVARAYANKHPESPLAKRADAPCGGTSPD
jgi:hypothetical protein